MGIIVLLLDKQRNKLLRSLLFFLSCVCMIRAEESFITQFEYGKMLYENPRGIGCMHCHGLEGEGKEVARYKTKKGTIQVLRGIQINNLNYERFKKGLEGNNRVMPRYYLTDSEIKAIHLYLEKMREFDK